ncbi:MAG: hypothetical protein KC680_01730 [Candidatus Peregrinibacteria bacterium]|nr:hypothetical protein [Candidatus Peregrinibacteria bacterium]MCB9807657.1 hypothetical protein [Candidatus Peribacteria bacterium]
MFHLFHFGHQPKAPQFGHGFLFNGLLCVFFGLAILAAPELLAYFVATVLLLIGASLLTTWWRIRNML